MAAINTNPVSILNPVGIQNLSTDPVFVKLGPGASSTVWDFVLAGSSVARDGTGGGFDLRGLHNVTLSFYTAGTLSYSLF